MTSPWNSNHQTPPWSQAGALYRSDRGRLTWSLWSLGDAPQLAAEGQVPRVDGVPVTWLGWGWRGWTWLGKSGVKFSWKSMVLMLLVLLLVWFWWFYIVSITMRMIRVVLYNIYCYVYEFWWFYTVICCYYYFKVVCFCVFCDWLFLLLYSSIIVVFFLTLGLIFWKANW